jgi:hypothetical protein
MSVMTKEGFGALKFSYLVLAAGVGVAAFLVAGSYFFWQAEKANNVTSQRRLSDALSRLANAKQQRDDLRDSVDTYNALTGRGVFIAEKRLDLLDAMDALRVRHRITSLEYQVGAQRQLKLAGGTSITAVEALGSRIQLKATALHDGDMLAFLDEFSRMQRGLFPIERCAIARNTKTGVSIPVTPTPKPASRSPDRGDNEPSGPPPTLTPAIEAECALEWITLVDKRAPVATPPVAGAAPQKAP